MSDPVKPEDKTPPRGAPVPRITPSYPPPPPRPQATLQGVGPSPALRAVAILLTHLGEAETAKNQGPVVEWACRRWVTQEFWDKHYPAGQMLWCAGAVCSALAEAGVDMKGIASVDADVLLLRMRKRWRVLPVEEAQPGDVVFFWSRDRTDGMRHVGLVEKVADGRMGTVEGNAKDQVRRRSYHLSDPGLAWVARVPG